MIPEISLPSNPDRRICLREATVKDVIDFTDIDQGHEEQVTTLFLNRMQDHQDRATQLDAKMWTADDRRAILFWYWIHTAKDPSIALSYECDFCGETHSLLQDMRILGEGYRNLDGKPERELRNGMLVRPLTGEDMEFLERGRLSLGVAAEEHGEKSGAYRKKEAQIRLLRLLLCLHSKEEPETLSRRVDATEKKILLMTTTEFGEMAEQVGDCLADMQHGLDTTMDELGTIYLFTPPHKCPNDEQKEAETRLRVPFRDIDYIPIF